MSSIVSPAEILEVFCSCRNDPHAWTAAQWLRNKGVSVQAYSEPDPVLAARVVVTDRYFDFASPDEDGIKAFILLGRNQSGPTDIIAWMPKTERLLTWLGAACVLGEDAVCAPRLSTDGALCVFRNPLSWLRANRRGIVLIDPAAAALHLHGLGPLVAEDAEHGLALRSILSLPAPRILIPNFEQAAA